jgi:LysM repeat protein
MKNELQTKRDTKQKSSFKTLYLRPKGQIKQNAVAAASPAQLGADTPNVGIGRGLIVILMLHVVAIGAVILHTSWTEGQGDPHSSQSLPLATVDEEKVDSNSKAETKVLDTNSPKGNQDKPLSQDKSSTSPIVKKEGDKTNPAKEQPKNNAGVRPSFISSGGGHEISKEPEGKKEPVRDVATTSPASGSGSPSAPASGKVGEYIVAKGDSISRISRRYKMTIDELKKLNKLESDFIREGQKLLVNK